MFWEIIKGALGPWGMVVMEFYLSHQVIINLIVVAYGITMIVIRRRRKNKAAATDKKEKTE